MKDILATIYKFLDGNKTIICTLILLMVSKGIIPLSPEWTEILEYVFGILGVGSLVDHVRKGYLTTEKGA